MSSLVVNRTVSFLVLMGIVLMLQDSVVGQQLGPSDHYQRGMDEYREGLLIAASVSFTEAIALKPDYAEAFVQRGLSFEGMDRAEAAMGDYREAIENGSDSLLPYQKLLAWSRNQGQYMQGIRVAQRLIENVPNNKAAGYWELGRFHELLDQSAEALVAFRRALQNYPVDEYSSVAERSFHRDLERKIERLQHP